MLMEDLSLVWETGMDKEYRNHKNTSYIILFYIYIYILKILLNSTKEIYSF